MNIQKSGVWIFGGGIALLIALSIAGPLFFERWFPKKSEIKKEDSSLALLTPPEKRPWIEVINASVLLRAPKGDTTRALASGDELDAGMIIDTDQTGRAIIHFQDGSIARVDRDTEFILEKGAYNESDKTLSVAIKLASGRIWSRIVELATPASLWEVKTANAVAVVRGTAFGVEYIDGVSRVIGSENEVTVIPIDPKTNERIEKAAVIITPEKFVEITGKGVSPVRNVPPEIKEADWIKEARIQQKEEKRSREEIKAPEVKINRVVAKELIIEMDLPSKTIREGEKKALRAIAIMSDGAKRDMSDRVTWRVIGAIGNITPDGAFTPKLIGAQAEFGSAVGSVVAVFKTEDGQELIGATPTFEVRALANEELDLRG